MEVYTIMAAKHFAIKALLKSEIDRLPIISLDIKKHLKSKGWEFVAFNLEDEKSVALLNRYGLLEFAKNHSGFSFMRDNIKLIFYRRDLTEEEKIQVFAHELGHIELEHFSKIGVLGYTPDGILNNAQENEANDFALEFQAPSCILKKAQFKTLDELHKNTLLNGCLLKQVYANIYSEESISTDEELLISKFKGYLLLHEKVHVKDKRKPVFGYVIPTAIIITVTMILLSNIPKQTKQENIKPLPEITTFTQLETSAPQTQRENLVIITSSGKKYHKPTCMYVKDKTNTVSLSIEEAINMGYESCEVCDPE